MQSRDWRGAADASSGCVLLFQGRVFQSGRERSPLCASANAVVAARAFSADKWAMQRVFLQLSVAALLLVSASMAFAQSATKFYSGVYNGAPCTLQMTWHNWKG